MSPEMTYLSHGQGRLFHAVGPATEKEQSPNFVYSALSFGLGCAMALYKSSYYYY